jgi:hypothetical protein
MPVRSWPLPQDHKGASFPPREKIPTPALDAVEKFLATRVRLADAARAAADAKRALTTATDTDRAALDEHVAAGGTSATFDYPATTEAKKAIEHTAADAQSLARIIGKDFYLPAVEALKQHADEGRQVADHDIEATATQYREAIDTAEQARRAYLDALGLRYFWDYLQGQHQCLATAGNADQITLAPRPGGRAGPITRIDDHTFKAMRSDAQAHTRLDGNSEHLTAW